MVEQQQQHENDYLWDGQGEAPADVARLEALLADFRYDQPLVFPAAPRVRKFRWRRLAIPAIAFAAAACVLAAGLALLSHFGQPGDDWKVVATSGRPAIGSSVIHGSSVLTAGGVLSTDATSTAELHAGAIGWIEVAPESVLRLLGSERGRHRLALDRGQIRARLWAKPFTFGFRTPSATAFDLGCAFTLTVNPDGRGVVHVDSGWVAFEQERQSLIPAGAEAIALPQHGPGTPFFDDAAPEFKAALERLDFAQMQPDERASALKLVLHRARVRDAFTLLNLFRDASDDERALIYDRLAQLAAPPPGVTREGMLGRDQHMMDAYWRSLGLGDVKSWWRHWRDLF